MEVRVLRLLSLTGRQNSALQFRMCQWLRVDSRERSVRFLAVGLRSQRYTSISNENRAENANDNVQQID